jgi:aminomethyltransferase
MVPFAGWLMPLRYSGIIKEHIHTRTQAGLFDISHMGELYCEEEDLDGLVSCRLDDLAPGRCRYALLLNNRGGIVDDLIVYRLSAGSLLLVVNASGDARDLEWLSSRGVAVRDASEQTAMLALQGPLSGEILGEYDARIEELRRFAFLHCKIEGIETLVSRTGYTGERGYELMLAREEASRLWELLLSRPGVLPAGLGARDSLRLEMGYPLHGHDIDEGHTPLEAGLGRFLFWKKDFAGKEALLKAGDPARRLTGLLCSGRRSIRAGYAVCDGAEEVGSVTSGVFSPSLNRGIGLAYVAASHAVEGSELAARGGGTELVVRVSSPPFLNPTSH